jgi:hypothetical protein
MEALRAGYLVRYTTLDDLVRELRQADQLGALRNKLSQYLRPHVLICDEVGAVEQHGEPLARGAIHPGWTMSNRTIPSWIFPGRRTSASVGGVPGRRGEVAPARRNTGTAALV